MFDNLKRSLHRFDKFSDSEFSRLTSCLNLLQLRKGEHFLKEGTICNHLGYVNKGIVMYYQLSDGIEIPRDFQMENEWVTYLKSLSNRTPSDMNIKAIEDTELFTISFDSAQKLFAEHPKFLQLRNALVEKSFVSVSDHGASLAMLDAKQRYHKLMKENPELINRVPHYYLAAYLGIKPQSLSRLRRG
jgi:CRP-like cAMP-binding protein